MDKDDGRIYLSYEVQGMLHELEKRLGMSGEAILEGMVKDRWNISDQKRNYERRREAWHKFSAAHDPDWQTKERVFMAGYNRGWIDFQTRHSNHMPELVVEFKEGGEDEAH